MLTKQEVNSASNQLDETDIAMIVPLVRNSQRYRDNLPLLADFPDLLSDVSGTVQAQQINAALAKIIELGVGEVAIKGGQDALDYSQTREREALVNYMISVLYIVSDVSSSIVFTAGSNKGGGYGVGQREIIGDFL